MNSRSLLRLSAFLTMTAVMIPTTWGHGAHQQTNRSPLGPMFRAAPPVLGAHGMQHIRFPTKEVAAARNLMNSQPFRAGFELGKDGRMHPATAPTTRTALILYDSSGDYGCVGNLYARQMGSLCTHFKMPATLVPVEQYTSGMMSSYTVTFYFGTTYQDPLPAAFLSDAMATPKPLVWMGYNLWQIAWTAEGGYNPAFTAKFGYEFNYMDGLTYSTVSYKGTKLTADPYGAGLANLTIKDKKLETTVATATAPATASTVASTTPYLIHSGNLWFIAENPLQDASPNLAPDRSAVIEDSIHDIIDDGITTATHRAVRRIEDVHAQVEPASLTAIGTYLQSVNAPYTVCVIPHYRDPLGYFNSGVPVDETINQVPALITALQGMASKNGQMMLHGDTHQYDDIANPNSGVSGDDCEFYIVQINPATGGEEYVSPTYEDSAAWCQGRLTEGFQIMAANGWTPTGWTTPEYVASLTDYQTFVTNFSYSMCRGLTFTTDESGNVYFVQQEIPWPVVDDLGMPRNPENLGYVSTAAYGVTDQRPQDLIAVATKLKPAIRDGWVGCYFHPFLAINLLKKLVSGLQDLGFTFVNPGPSWVGGE